MDHCRMKESISNHCHMNKCPFFFSITNWYYTIVIQRIVCSWGLLRIQHQIWLCSCVCQKVKARPSIFFEAEYLFCHYPCCGFMQNHCFHFCTSLLSLLHSVHMETVATLNVKKHQPSRNHKDSHTLCRQSLSTLTSPHTHAHICSGSAPKHVKYCTHTGTSTNTRKPRNSVSTNQTKLQLPRKHMR